MSDIAALQQHIKEAIIEEEGSLPQPEKSKNKRLIHRTFLKNKKAKKMAKKSRRKNR